MFFFAARRAAAVCALSILFLPALPAHAIVAGNPNPPKDSSGNNLYPADSPNNPYNPATQTGRLDMLGLLSPFSGVGAIFGGTGTLLDSTHVLTAAHLFGSSGTLSGVGFSLDSGTGMVSFAASRVDVSPDFRGVNPDDAGDIAIVTLSAPVPATYRTYGLYTGALTSGTTLTMVGYGDSGNGVTGYDSSARARRVGKNNADAFLLPGGMSYDTTYQPGDGVYLFDFDSPDGDTASAPNVIGGLSLGNDVEATLGNGDSGGPGFVLVNGQYEIAALNNFLIQYGTDANPGPNFPLFGSGGGGVVVSAYTGFLSGFVPVPAPEPAPWLVLGVGGLLLGGRAVRRGRKS